MEQEEQIENKNGEKREEREEATEDSFLKDLYFFMKQRDTPIERIPHLGFKQIELYLMFKTVKDLGGYHQVTAQQLWKKVYNILGGNPRSTSAATCTRRHYEKLLLPYEYHLAGYGDDIPVSPPRKHKLPIGLDDYPLSTKHRFIGKPFTFNEYPPCEFLTDGHLRIISMPGGIPQRSILVHPGPKSLPNYFVPHSSPPITNASPAFPTPPTESYPPCAFKNESFNQPLHFLRQLSEHYKLSSLGLTEPLNLSNKKGRLEISSNPPSSFSPPPLKKQPKFLNEALPLYPSRSDKPGAASGAARADAPVQAVVNPMSINESHAVNLTSPSTTSPTLKKPPPSPTSPLTQRPSYPNFQTPLKSKTGSYDMPQSNPNPIPSRPTSDPYNGMEIQIPFYLLQNWIKEGLISSLTSNYKHTSGSLPQESYKDPSPESVSQRRTSSDTSEHLISSLASTHNQSPGHVSQEPNNAPSSPDTFSWGRPSSRSLDSISSDLPADLSLKNHKREPANPSKQDTESSTSPVTIEESHLPNINRYASVNPFIIKATGKIPLSPDSFHRVSYMKPSRIDEQEAFPKHFIRASSRDKDNSGTYNPGSNADFTPNTDARHGEVPEKPSSLKLNSASSSLIHISPEHLKFLLSKQHLRPGRGQIC
ncbi:AT-rich interaction domain 6 [Hoplias malabaricus]|uniref:AT-rich interaction domain 6 n=1 Tax=Hoplias malabaricus TaxID=27720 RepID=UPI003461BA31